PTNDVYVIVYPQGQDVMSAPFCALNLTESTQGPPTPVDISAGAGDGAVTINWAQAQTGTAGNATVSFQVLCADKDGNPVPGKLSSQQAYSVCLHGNISRRNNIFFGGTGTGTGDGGTSSSFDFATSTTGMS